MFNWAIGVGEEYKKAEGILNNTLPLFDRADYTPEEITQAKKTVKSLGWKYRLADKLVFKKIREVTGGELRFAISGGGALLETVDIFFDAVGIVVCEGYGLTETSPVPNCKKSGKLHYVHRWLSPTGSRDKDCG